MHNYFRRKPFASMKMDDNREVIELINKLQGYRSSTGCEIQIELPQIVVVGAQSSGKSSVLDGLIGSSILPRGAGTVTKCPIIVQLVTTPDLDQAGVEFQDAPEDGRIKDTDIVRAKISERMERGGGSISDEPIIIKVFSPNVVTLTVVDLPGIKRLTSYGEPNNLEQLIFNLSRKYIKEKNAIILAVSPANYDICNSDGILLANEADPDGDRTIGVLTKLDLMDDGTNARSLLTGTSKDVNVKLGMIGLVNRSQKDIDNNLTVEAQLKKESKFLEELYPDIADQHGVPYLRKRLHELLVHHILACLPEIQSKMEKLLEKCKEKIKAIPDVSTKEAKFRYANRIILGFENYMKKELEGDSRHPEYKYVSGGIRIKEVFEGQFAQDMNKAGMDNSASITDEMIITAFKNSGSFDSFFVYPEAVFRKLAQDQIKKIEKPALDCAQKVHDQIVKIADRYISKQQLSFDLFPDFRRSIKDVVHRMLEEKRVGVQNQIKDYIKIQASVVFSLDQSFLRLMSSLRRNLEARLYDEDMTNEESDVDDEASSVDWLKDKNTDKMFPSPPTDQFNHSMDLNPNNLSGHERMLVKLRNPSITRLIKEMVGFYFHHVKMQIQDYIPKLVADRIITQFSGEEDGSLSLELRVHVMEHYDELVNLPSNISEMRVKNVKLQEHLKEVIDEIQGLRNAYKFDDQNGYYSAHELTDEEDF